MGLRSRIARLEQILPAPPDDGPMSPEEQAKLISFCRCVGRIHWRELAAQYPESTEDYARIERLAESGAPGHPRWHDQSLTLEDDPNGLSQYRRFRESMP